VLSIVPIEIEIIPPYARSSPRSTEFNTALVVATDRGTELLFFGKHFIATFLTPIAN
jgi:hypothetical protein